MKNNNTKSKSISIVIPVYNEEGVIHELWERLEEEIKLITAYDWEVLFVDDGSEDDSRKHIKKLQSKDERIRYLRLSRNFGHQGALTAGIDHANGNAVVLMDADLQDKPEAIPLFVKQWEAGASVVYASRVKRKEGGIKRFGFYVFYRIIQKLSGTPQPPDAGIFSLVDKSVLDHVRKMPEHNRYFPGLRAYAGFNQVGVVVERGERFSGTPRVGFKGLIKLAFDAVFSFSYIPLRLISFAGCFVAIGAFLFIIVIAYKKYVIHEAILGWSSVLGAILFLGGLQIVMLGIVGEYIGRIYEETKCRPMYIIAEQD